MIQTTIIITATQWSSGTNSSGHNNSSQLRVPYSINSLFMKGTSLNTFRSVPCAPPITTVLFHVSPRGPYQTKQPPKKKYVDCGSYGGMLEEIMGYVDCGSYGGMLEEIMG
ncbi:hypothetical protein QE152_g10900 [Popillia japonica]|uniref:Uncharacterized protein n=1 Tax=Popillia japonica TaxID=7064 RepID=A0AAW1LTQ6_POPJA